MSEDAQSDDGHGAAGHGAAGQRAAEQHRADHALVRRALAGQREARAEVARRLAVAGRVLAVRNARLGRPLADDELADLVQDVVLVVWRKLAAFEGRSTLETWVYRFCILELMNHLRRRSRRPESLDAAALEPAAAAAAETERPEEGRDAAEDAERALARLVRHLAPREAQIVRLRHVDGLTLADAGAALGISASSAKTHYYRALEKLRGLLGARARPAEEAR